MAAGALCRRSGGAAAHGPTRTCADGGGGKPRAACARQPLTTRHLHGLASHLGSRRAHGQWDLDITVCFGGIVLGLLKVSAPEVGAHFEEKGLAEGQENGTREELRR